MSTHSKIQLKFCFNGRTLSRNDFDSHLSELVFYKNQLIAIVMIHSLVRPLNPSKSAKK